MATMVVVTFSTPKLGVKILDFVSLYDVGAPRLSPSCGRHREAHVSLGL
jgi:hypothetical protein